MPSQSEREEFEKAELPVEGKDLPTYEQEIKAHEANEDTKPSEMATDNILAELDGHWRGWEVPKMSPVSPLSTEQDMHPS